MKRSIASLLCGFIGMAGLCCDRGTESSQSAEPPANSAVDKAVTVTKNGIDAAADATKRAADATRRALNKAADKTAQAVDTAVDATGRALEKTGDAIRNAGEQAQESANVQRSPVDMLHERYTLLRPRIDRLTRAGSEIQDLTLLAAYNKDMAEINTAMARVSELLAQQKIQPPQDPLLTTQSISTQLKSVEDKVDVATVKYVR